MPYLAEHWIAHHLLSLETIAGLEQFGITRHVIALFFVTILLLVTFIPFGRRVQAHVAPRGALVNFIEVILIFLRDEVSRPILGKEGDKYLPVVWTFFFFILYCNLLGLVPFLYPPTTDGQASIFSAVTATGRPEVTATLAFIAFVWWHGLGIKEQGVVAYVRHIIPGGLPGPIKPLMFVLETIGHIIKPCALLVRLCANMVGGHAVLYAMIGFIFIFPLIWYVMIPVSVIAGVAVFFLEIFVAFLQAFVFTFLVVVFLGGALHPH